jgi:endo-1,4-beta-xylanase
VRTTRARLVVSTIAASAALALIPAVASAQPGDPLPAPPSQASHPATPSAPGSKVPDDSLRALGAKVGLRIGTAVNTDELASDSTYDSITAQQFSTVTPENVMKWEVIEPEQGTYNFAPADQLVSFAEAHGQLVRGHNLVWQNQLPAWFTAEVGSLSSDQVKAILKQHIMSEVSHFKGKIWQWDVVNEPFNEDGTLTDNIWYQKLGADYIADAFTWAHQADPHAKLFLNDYNLEYTGSKSNAALAFVQQLKANHVPIDGVGFETHLDTQYGQPDLLNNLQRFAAAGLDVAITEADVRTTLPVTAVEQAAQNADYSLSLQACLQVSRCISYTVWGFDDKFSWVPGTFSGEGAADIYSDFQPKPQYTTLQQDLELATGSAPRVRH